MTSTVLVEKKKLDAPPHNLHYLGDKVLRQSCKRVSKVDQNTRKFAKELLQTMYSSDGIGLAAPQVGTLRQMLVVDCEPDNAATPPKILINPVIKRHTKDTIVGPEGCLSIPGVYLDVERYAAVEVAYKDEYGRPQKLLAKDLLGRAIQHEMDHLSGIMFVDRINNSLVLAEELSKHGFSASDVQPIS
jgi:peptide deformylase